MNIAILTRPNDPLSLRLYESNIIRELASIGVEISLFPEECPIPSECDLVWDPAMCMRRVPRILKTCTVPVIGTMHGVKAFSLPLEELATSLVEQKDLLRLKEEVVEDWKWFRGKASAMVAVSNFSRKELVDAFKLTSDMVHVIHHGVDRSIFFPEGESANIGQPYLLHVSRLDPIKNIDRILAAYSSLPVEGRPDLVIVGIPEPDQTTFSIEFGRKVAIHGVHWLREEISQEELARWYRGALALLFPSLRETFGLPIIEAMACGCPVITSNDTGCVEAAGDAAILVNPRFLDDITSAMQCLIDEPGLRQKLIKAGLDRASRFTWQNSAKRLLQVFQSVIPQSRKCNPRMRKIEVTTVASCCMDCQFCPQRIFQRNYTVSGAKSIMDWETYLTCINKLPPYVGVSFGGMSEPFQNPLCTNMVLYSKERGHTLEIFTTLMGLNMENLERLIEELSLGTSPLDDRLFIHLPSVEQLEKISIDENYLCMLGYLLSLSHDVEFHYHGSRIHDALRTLPFDERLRHWPLHNRAVNETAFYGRRKKKNGKIECVMNLEVNFLLPNGDVLVCCQDFGVQHVIGNLLHSNHDTLYESSEFKRIQAALQDDEQEIMCRYCDFSVQEISSRDEGGD